MHLAALTFAKSPSYSKKIKSLTWMRELNADKFSRLGFSFHFSIFDFNPIYFVEHALVFFVFVFFFKLHYPNKYVDAYLFYLDSTIKNVFN